VTCSKSPTRFVKLINLIVPPAFCALVRSSTSVPRPLESTYLLPWTYVTYQLTNRIGGEAYYFPYGLSTVPGPSNICWSGQNWSTRGHISNWALDTVATRQRAILGRADRLSQARCEAGRWETLKSGCSDCPKTNCSFNYVM